MVAVNSAGLVHRDLALRNVLCVIFDVETGAVLVKVSDFGLSKEASYYYGGDLAIPVRWTSPEALCNRKKFSQKSDVWSLGVVIWELLNMGQKMPYWQQQDDGKLTEEIGTGKRTLERPEGSDELLWSVAQDHCLKMNPKDRPTFAGLLLHLREMRLDEEMSMRKKEWEAAERQNVLAEALAEAQEEANKILEQARKEAAMMHLSAAGAAKGGSQSAAPVPEVGACVLSLRVACFGLLVVS